MGIVQKSDLFFERVHAVLDEVRPAIQMDGGDIELVEVRDGTVYIRLLGACDGCPLSVYTVKMGIEEALKEQIPDIYEVVTVQNEEV